MERRKNPPKVKPVDALQLCIDAAGNDNKITDDEIAAHEFIFILVLQLLLIMTFKAYAFLIAYLKIYKL